MQIQSNQIFLSTFVEMVQKVQTEIESLNVLSHQCGTKVFELTVRGVQQPLNVQQKYLYNHLINTWKLSIGFS